MFGAWRKIGRVSERAHETRGLVPPAPDLGHGVLVDGTRQLYAVCEVGVVQQDVAAIQLDHGTTFQMRSEVASLYNTIDHAKHSGTTIWT